jgi:hypothetical protein
VNFPQVDFHIKRDLYVYMRIVEGHALPSGSDRGDDFTNNVECKLNNYGEGTTSRGEIVKEYRMFC